ncbi:hypothetical protein [Mycolicibacterium septicum]|uniref:hypothetical protein n=1 Tax=Mycolicibacterium septicum TaxID=98668 RepID=UPI001AF31224|nr:hypothetical protein [Mycolicibacterium septicum]QRY51750.1 hypothetical protein JVX95_30990 [Mycolicibacterium septicum]
MSNSATQAGREAGEAISADIIGASLCVFHEWLRERIINNEGVDPLGDCADTVDEFMAEVKAAVAE